MWIEKKPTLSQMIFAIALLLLAWQLGRALLEYARLARAALAFPFPLDYAEGPALDQTLRLAHLENIYRNNLSAPPYTLTNDPPLFHAIQAPFVWIFGPAFWYGRLISVIGAITSAVWIGLILHALTGDPIASAVGGLTLPAFPYILQGSVLSQAGTLPLALSLGGLYAIVRWPDRRRGWLMSGLLFTAAIFTRQNYVLAAPLAGCAWLLQAQRRRPAFMLAATAAVGCVGLSLLLNLLTQGGFYLNVVIASVTSFSWFTVVKYLIDIYLNAGYLVIGCIVYLIVERLGHPTPAWPLVTPYLFGAALTAMTVGLAASSVNVVFEFVAALCLATGAMLAWSGDNYWLKAILAFVLAWQFNALIAWSRQEYVPPLMEKVAAYRDVAQMAELVRKAQGPVLADEYMGLIPLSGRRLYFQPLEFRQLLAVHRWSQDSLVAAIQREEFSAILLYEPRRWNAILTRWTPELRDDIYAHYRLETTLAETFVYLPKGDSK